MARNPRELRELSTAELEVMIEQDDARGWDAAAVLDEFEARERDQPQAPPEPARGWGRTALIAIAAMALGAGLAALAMTMRVDASRFAVVVADSRVFRIDRVTGETFELKTTGSRQWVLRVGPVGDWGRVLGR